MNSRQIILYIGTLVDLTTVGRLAEWSKAPDLSSGTREGAWVRTPHLTILFCFMNVLEQNKEHDEHFFFYYLVDQFKYFRNKTSAFAFFIM